MLAFSLNSHRQAFAAVAYGTKNLCWPHNVAFAVAAGDAHEWLAVGVVATRVGASVTCALEAPCVGTYCTVVDANDERAHAHFGNGVAQQLYRWKCAK